VKMTMPWLSPAQPFKPAAVTPVERQRILDTIAAASESHARQCIHDAENQTRVEAKVRAAEEALTETRREAADFQAAQMGRSLAHDLRIRRQQALLRAGAPEVIDRFITDVDAAVEATRRAVQVIGSTDRGRDEVTGALLESTVATNTASVRRRLDALYTARTRAEELKLAMDVSEEAVKVILRDLLTTIPDVEPAFRTLGDIHSPGELRTIAWRVEGATR
jgi:hypothetical protein